MHDFALEAEQTKLACLCDAACMRRIAHPNLTTYGCRRGKKALHNLTASSRATEDGWRAQQQLQAVFRIDA